MFFIKPLELYVDGQLDEAANIQADEYDSDIYDIEPTERKSLSNFSNGVLTGNHQGLRSKSSSSTPLTKMPWYKTFV